MKKIILFLICINEVNAQQLTPQIAPQSCWAACIEMINPDSTQCKMIQGSNGFLREYCDCNLPTCKIDMIQTASVRDELMKNRKKCYTVITRNMTEIQKHLNGYKLFENKSKISFDVFTQLYNNGKYVLNSFQYGGSEQNNHAVVIGKTFEQNLRGESKMKWIKIFDPSPICTGRIYYQSYERYLESNNMCLADTTTISTPLNMTSVDFSYQNAKLRVIHKMSSTKLITLFINQLSPVSDTDFIETTNFDNSKPITINPKIFKIIYINNSFFITRNKLKAKLNAILDIGTDADMLVLQTQKGMSSVFITKQIGNEYPGKKIVSHIENGDKLKELIKASKLKELIKKISIKENQQKSEREQALKEYFSKSDDHYLMINFKELDAVYIFTMVNDKIYVFDQYNFFFPLINNNQRKLISFKEFENSFLQFANKQ